VFVYIQLRTPIPPNSPVQRLVGILDELCAVIAARRAGGVLTVPLFFLLWRRVRHTAVRAIKLAARITAGVPPRITRPRAAPRPPRPPTLRLPCRFAWVAVVVPGTAVFGCQLQHLVAQPELAPLVADPRMRRLLNPLLRMLGAPRLPPLPPRPAAVPPTCAEPAWRGTDDSASPGRGLPRSPGPPRQGGGTSEEPPDPPAPPVAA
jgi:hypothetical protein